VIGLAIAWLGETSGFLLPDAADVQVESFNLSHERMAYHLPLARTPNDLFRQLEQYGWTRDRAAEQVLRRDRMESLGATVAIFRRPGWIVREVATIVISPSDTHLAEIRLARCFAITPWSRCL
jgi:hypothetical protein